MCQNAGTVTAIKTHPGHRGAGLESYLRLGSMILFLSDLVRTGIWAVAIAQSV